MYYKFVEVGTPETAGEQTIGPTCTGYWKKIEPKEYKKALKSFRITNFSIQTDGHLLVETTGGNFKVENYNNVIHT